MSWFACRKLNSDFGMILATSASRILAIYMRVSGIWSHTNPTKTAFVLYLVLVLYTLYTSTLGIQRERRPVAPELACKNSYSSSTTFGESTSGLLGLTLWPSNFRILKTFIFYIYKGYCDGSQILIVGIYWPKTLGYLTSTCTVFSC